MPLSLRSLIVSCCLLVAGGASAQTGYVPDSSFSNTGFTEYYQQQAVNVIGYRTMYAPDNSLLVAGVIMDSIAVWKYKPDGSLDASFGTAGHVAAKVTTPGMIRVRGLECQRDNKIVVLFHVWDIHLGNMDLSQGWIGLYRFTANGAPDPTFASGGGLVHKPLSGYEYEPHSLAIDTFGAVDGIYVGGRAAETGHSTCPAGFGKWVIAKYTATGSLDPSFNSIGILQETATDIMQTQAATPLAIVYTMIVTPQQKVLAAGQLNGDDMGFFSLRVNADGSYDNSYGANGRSSFPVASFLVPVNDLTDAEIASDGSVYFFTQLIYYDSFQDSSVLNVMKADPQGNLVTNFGGSGTLNYHYLGFYKNVVFDNDQRMLLGWYRSYSGIKQDIHFTRFTSGGLIDNSFGTSGSLISEPVLNDAYLNKSLIQDMAFNPKTGTVAVVSNRSTMAMAGFMGLLQYKPTGITGLEEVVAGRSPFTIYPNPAGQHISLETDRSLLSYTLFNTSGQIVKTGTSPRNNAIDVETLSAGPYIIKAQTTEGKMLSGSFIKQ